jgi:hypothetical protein
MTMPRTSTPPRDALAAALRETLISPNVSDDNWEPANVVDVLNKVARALTWMSFGDNTNKGPGEVLGERVKEAAHEIAVGLSDVADAIRQAARLET